MWVNDKQVCPTYTNIFFCKEFQSFNEALFFSFFSVPRQIDHLKMFDFDLHKNIKLNFNSKTEKKKKVYNRKFSFYELHIIMFQL